MRGLAFGARCVLIGLCIGLAAGCAAKRPAITRVIFKNCAVTAPGQCECKNIAWAVDAKTGNPVALCGAKK